MEKLFRGWLKVNMLGQIFPLLFMPFFPTQIMYISGCFEDVKNTKTQINFDGACWTRPKNCFDDLKEKKIAESFIISVMFVWPNPCQVVCYSAYAVQVGCGVVGSEHCRAMQVT